ncbi:MAG: DUF63 family protein [Candidatus Micrarchaeota archaeon]|nr:DUF63 family protein [Candidatus Micrarchaeota archaeon]
MENIFHEYFVSPIFERSGYNLVNTSVYAAIALASLYVIWKVLKGKGYDFGSREFLYGTAAFVLFGSTSRVITDLWDAGFVAEAAKQNGFYYALYSSGLFEYGYLTVTPGIYIVTAALFLTSIALGMAMRNNKFPVFVGGILWLLCLAILLPFAAHFEFFLLAIAVACIVSFAAFHLLEHATKAQANLHEKLAISGQALDGAATFVVIDVFSKASGKVYFEQHVIPSIIGAATPLGFLLFLIVKVVLASAIVYLLRKEKIEWGDRALVLVVVAIMGFAPGLRDILRMLCGT